jgi:hypothetical protein
MTQRLRPPTGKTCEAMIIDEPYGEAVIGVDHAGGQDRASIETFLRVGGSLWMIPARPAPWMREMMDHGPPSDEADAIAYGAPSYAGRQP